VVLVRAKLQGANLSGATGLPNEELERHTKFLKYATMPNDQKYEDWLKDREERQENRENSGPS
jgi:hypothetical protein